eukprot:CAMPEP_0117616568 /NCGR_PEP_ID=MMETSP0784-20121206/85126_1 /TAXON_ID=39447 /ORGANISM="" /LENGTH=128 /DNA_ID=CAMNT_0005420347 /DNA_START=385 /DNA_END=771 /DNA_ORIENTATION=-
MVVEASHASLASVAVVGAPARIWRRPPDKASDAVGATVLPVDVFQRAQAFAGGQTPRNLCGYWEARGRRSRDLTSTTEDNVRRARHSDRRPRPDRRHEQGCQRKVWTLARNHYTAREADQHRADPKHG